MYQYKNVLEFRSCNDGMRQLKKRKYGNYLGGMWMYHPVDRSAKRFSPSRFPFTPVRF